MGLEWIIICMILAELMFVLYILYLITHAEGFPVLNFTGMKQFLAFSVPQMPSGVLLWIIAASDRYFITHFLGLSETGIYSSSNALGG